MTTKFVQCQNPKLKVAIGPSDTSAVFTEFVDLNGDPITQTDFGTTGYGTLAPNTEREEAVSFTIVSNTTGEATLTLTRGLLGKAPYGTGGPTYTHQAQTELVISNNPDLLNKLTAKDNDEEVTGSWKFPATPTHNQNPATKVWVESQDQLLQSNIDTLDAEVVKLTGSQTVAGIKTFSSSPVIPTPTNTSEAATKGYVDNVTVSGAPNADETTKGIVQEATSEQFSSGVGVGSTGAKLFGTPEKILSFLRSAITSSLGTTHSITTNGSQKVFVLAKGTLDPTTASHTVTLKYNGVTKDTVVIDSGGAGFYPQQPFSLMYLEIPGSGTNDVTVETTGGTLNNVVITSIII